MDFFPTKPTLIVHLAMTIFLAISVSTQHVWESSQLAAKSPLPPPATSFTLASPTPSPHEAHLLSDTISFSATPRAQQATTMDIQAPPTAVFNTLRPDGTYAFGYKTLDGQSRTENTLPDGTKLGSYEFRTPDGNLVTINYSAGRHGFVISPGSSHGSIYVTSSSQPPSSSSGDRPYSMDFASNNHRQPLHNNPDFPNFSNGQRGSGNVNRFRIDSEASNSEAKGSNTHASNPFEIIRSKSVPVTSFAGVERFSSDNHGNKDVAIVKSNIVASSLSGSNSIASSTKSFPSSERILDAYNSMAYIVSNPASVALPPNVNKGSSSGNGIGSSSVNGIGSSSMSSSSSSSSSTNNKLVTSDTTSSLFVHNSAKPMKNNLGQVAYASGDIGMSAGKNPASKSSVDGQNNVEKLTTISGSAQQTSTPFWLNAVLAQREFDQQPPYYPFGRWLLPERQTSPPVSNNAHAYQAGSSSISGSNVYPYGFVYRLNQQGVQAQQQQQQHQYLG